MTRKCSVLQCWTGKDSTRHLCHGRRISFHRFPLKDPKMLRRWEVAVKRPKTGSGRGVWPGPTIHSSVCSLHFKESDFETESQDKNVTRRLRKQDGGSLLRVKLTKSAVPSIFFEDQSEWAEAVKVSRKHSLGQAPSLEEAINMGKFDHVSKKKMAQTKEQIRLRKEQAALDMINTCIIAGCNNDACNLAGGVAFFQSVSLQPVLEWTHGLILYLFRLLAGSPKKKASVAVLCSCAGATRGCSRHPWPGSARSTSTPPPPWSSGATGALAASPHTLATSGTLP